METRDGLEAALVASWDRDTLAVYADHLQSLGDPRGELIVLDLELEQRSTPELVARRVSLLSGWLGSLVPSDPNRPWVGDTFRLGFVEDLVIDGHDPNAFDRLASVMGSPLALYLKRATIHGDAQMIARALGSLVRVEHAWLRHLAVRRCTEGAPLDEAMVAAIIGATPRLETLEVQGTGVFAAFEHPALKRLRVTGWSALPGLFAETTEFSEVSELDLAFYEPYDAEHYAPQAQVDRDATLALPALRRLDLSRNEPEVASMQGYDWEGYEPEDAERDTSSLTALGFLGSLDLRGQLTHLKLPSLRSHDEFVELTAAVADMPALVELEVVRGHYYRAPDLPNSDASFTRPAPWPWPRRVEPGECLEIAVPDSRSPDLVALGDAVAAMERHFEDLPADARYAWTRLWVFVAGLDKAAQTLPADILVTAIESCEIATGGWRQLKEELRYRRPLAPNATVTISRTIAE